MLLHIRVDGDVVVLSNIGHLMNDPRYTSAGQDVQELLAQGFKNFILELADTRESGPPLLGLLMTLTREVRRSGGEVVLARLNRGLERYVEMMQMDEFWEVFATVNDAKEFFQEAPK
jgi:anti-sigma B factor antagonist